MRRLPLFLIAFFMFSCGAKKSVAHLTMADLLSECPKAGSCTVELLQNKSMVVTQNENRINYTLTDNPEKNVIVFKYNKTVKGNLQDASYREEIIFETNQAITNGNLSDSGLQSTQMLFGRFCYCKGQTGYYKVNKGKMTIGSRGLELDFSISEVPQIINYIQLSLK